MAPADAANVVAVGACDDPHPDTRLRCDPNEATFLVLDSLARGDSRAYPLPFPAGGVRGRVTAANSVRLAMLERG